MSSRRKRVVVSCGNAWRKQIDLSPGPFGGPASVQQISFLQRLGISKEESHGWTIRRAALAIDQRLNHGSHVPFDSMDSPDEVAALPPQTSGISDEQLIERLEKARLLAGDLQSELISIVKELKLRKLAQHISTAKQD